MKRHFVIFDENDINAKRVLFTDEDDPNLKNEKVASFISHDIESSVSLMFEGLMLNDNKGLLYNEKTANAFKALMIGAINCGQEENLYEIMIEILSSFSFPDDATAEDIAYNDYISNAIKALIQ